MNERVYRVNQWMNKYSGWISVLMNKTKWINWWMHWTGSSGWVRVGLRLGQCMRREGGGGCADSVQFSTDIRSEISKPLNVSKLNTMYNALYMI